METIEKKQMLIEYMTVDGTKSGKAAVISFMDSVEKTFGITPKNDENGKPKYSTVAVLSDAQLDLLKSRTLNTRGTAAANLNSELARLVGNCRSFATVQVEHFPKGSKFMNKLGEEVTREKDDWNYSVTSIILPAKQNELLDSVAIKNVADAWVNPVFQMPSVPTELASATE